MADTGSVTKFINKFAIFIVLGLMAVALSFLSPSFLTPQNLINVLISESGRGMLAIGVAFTIIAKGIDISVGSIVSLTSVVAASLVQDPTYANRIFPNLPHIPVIFAVLAGLSAGTIVGMINGWFIAYTAIPPFIATLGSMIIARGVALILTNAYPVPMLRADFKNLGQGNIGPMPIIVLVFIVVIVLSWILLNQTKFGKNLYAIGGNVHAAKTSGIKVEKNLVAIYAFSGFCASIAGVLITARAASGIATLGNSYELDAIAAAFIGGVSPAGGIGKVLGSLIGALVYMSLTSGMNLMGTDIALQYIVRGLVLAAAVIFDVTTRRTGK